MYDFLSSNQVKSIRYELKNDVGGWQLSVVLPKRVSPSDQLTVINWLHDYQASVRSQHPNWLTTIRSEANGYTLHIRKTENSRDMLNAVNLISQGDAIKNCWSGALEYAG